MNNKHRTVFATTWGFRGVIMVNHPWERLILASYPCLRLSTFLIHLALFFVRSLHFSLITSHTFHSTVFYTVMVIRKVHPTCCKRHRIPLKSSSVGGNASNSTGISYQMTKKRYISSNHVFFVFWEVASATQKLMIKTRIKANHILVKAFIWCICIILWIWIFIRIFITAVLSSFFSFLPIVILVRLRVGHLEFTISRLILYVSSPSTHFAPVQLKPRKHWGWNGFAWWNKTQNGRWLKKTRRQFSRSLNLSCL